MTNPLAQFLVTALEVSEAWESAMEDVINGLREPGTCHEVMATALKDAEAAGYRRALGEAAKVADTLRENLQKCRGTYMYEDLIILSRRIRALNPHPALPEGEVK